VGGLRGAQGHPEDEEVAQGVGRCGQGVALLVGQGQGEPEEQAVAHRDEEERGPGHGPVRQG